MSISNFNKYYYYYKNYFKQFIKKNYYYKPLIKGLLKNNAGRNNKGFITAYHLGGGVQRLYKKVCFDYIKLLSKGLNKWVVIRIEYDNNRSSNVALLKSILDISKLKKKFKIFFNIYYIYKLANEGLKKDHLVEFFNDNDHYCPENGQYVQLFNIFTGSNIFNIEFNLSTKGKLIRAAGSKAKFLRKYNKYGLISLPSGEKKLISLLCFATVGIPSNSLLLFKKNYKAGTLRLKNRRPIVRGVAQNPVDHPHGGGEGKTSGGRHPVSPWGLLTKGYVTKRKKIKKKKKYV